MTKPEMLDKLSFDTKKFKYKAIKNLSFTIISLIIIYLFNYIELNFSLNENIRNIIDLLFSILILTSTYTFLNFLKFYFKRIQSSYKYIKIKNNDNYIVF